MSLELSWESREVRAEGNDAYPPRGDSPAPSYAFELFCYADERDLQYGVATPGHAVLVIEFVAYDANQRPLTFETAVITERVRVAPTRPPR